MIKTGKEIILNYCKNIKTHSIQHLEDCLFIEETIEYYDDINELLVRLSDSDYCPADFGLDNFKHECNDEFYIDEQYIKC